ncbi:hypothetical protein, partial [Massilia horti]
MSDLIASLVARVSGDVPALEPRLPSRFEPDTRSDAAVADEPMPGMEMSRADPREAAAAAPFVSTAGQAPAQAGVAA